MGGPNQGDLSMDKDRMTELAKKAREKCEGCREDIPLKGTPSRQLGHLNMLATPEAGVWMLCKAAKIHEMVRLGWDQRHNPLYVDGWEEILTDLWESDPEIWGDPGEEETEG